MTTPTVTEIKSSRGAPWLDEEEYKPRVRRPNPRYTEMAAMDDGGLVFFFVFDKEDRATSGKTWGPIRQATYSQENIGCDEIVAVDRDGNVDNLYAWADNEC